jgi:hypothetical protein
MEDKKVANRPSMFFSYYSLEQLYILKSIQGKCLDMRLLKN